MCIPNIPIFGAYPGISPITICLDIEDPWNSLGISQITVDFPIYRCDHTCIYIYMYNIILYIYTHYCFNHFESNDKNKIRVKYHRRLIIF